MELSGFRIIDAESSYVPLNDAGGGDAASFTPASTAVTAPVVAPQTAPVSVDQLLREAGIDLSTLNPDLANAIRSRVTATDGKLDLSGLYFNGIGDDLANRVNAAINGLNNWQAGIGTIQYGESSDYTYSVPEMAVNAGGHGIISNGAVDAAALPTLNALVAQLRHTPEPPKTLTAAQAQKFNQLVAQTGDGHWVRMPAQYLGKMLDAISVKADGSLDLGAVFGGRLGYDAGPPSDVYARQMELISFTEEYSSVVQYGYYVPDGVDSSRFVPFTVPDPSVGSIVMEERFGGGDNGNWFVPVYKPSEATVARYNADLARYNESFGLLETNNLTQVRPGAGNTMNIGNDYGYIGAENVIWTERFGLVTSKDNIKYPEDDDDWFDFILIVAVIVVACVAGPEILAALEGIGSGAVALEGGAAVAAEGALVEGAATAALEGAVADGALGVVAAEGGSAGMCTIADAAIDAAIDLAIEGAQAGALRGAATTALQGGDLGDILEGAARGAAVGAVSGAVGGYLDVMAPGWIPDTGVDVLDAVIEDTVVNTAVNTVQNGGDVEAGFEQGLVQAITQNTVDINSALTPLVNDLIPDTGNVLVDRVITQTLVGGTVNTLTNGGDAEAAFRTSLASALGRAFKDGLGADLIPTTGEAAADKVISETLTNGIINTIRNGGDAEAGFRTAFAASLGSVLGGEASARLLASGEVTSADWLKLIEATVRGGVTALVNGNDGQLTAAGAGFLSNAFGLMLSADMKDAGFSQNMQSVSGQALTRFLDAALRGQAGQGLLQAGQLLGGSSAAKDLIAEGKAAVFWEVLELTGDVEWARTAADMAEKLLNKTFQGDPRTGAIDAGKTLGAVIARALGIDPNNIAGSLLGNNTSTAGSSTPAATTTGSAATTTTPATPAATAPAATDDNGWGDLPAPGGTEPAWQWYDDGMPVDTAPAETAPAETAPADDSGAADDREALNDAFWSSFYGSPPVTVPPPATDPVEDGAGQTPSASNDNGDTAPGETAGTGAADAAGTNPAPAASPVRTIIVGSAPGLGTLWGIARSVVTNQNQMLAQIGQMIVENDLSGSVVQPGQPLRVVPATLDNYTAAQLQAFRQRAQEALTADNNRLAEANRPSNPAPTPDASGAQGGSTPAAGVPVPGSTAPAPTTDPASGLPDTGVMNRILNTAGATAFVVGYSPAAGAGAAMNAAGGQFALVNSDGATYLQSLPRTAPLTVPLPILGNSGWRATYVNSTNTNGVVSSGFGFAGVLPVIPPNRSSVLGHGLQGLIFGNQRTETPPREVTENGQTYLVQSYNVGVALNAQDLVDAGLGTAATIMMRVPALWQYAAGSRLLAEGVNASKGIANGWVGIAYRWTARYDLNGNFLGFYDGAGHRVTDVTSTISNSVDRLLNGLQSLSPFNASQSLETDNLTPLLQVGP